MKARIQHWSMPSEVAVIIAIVFGPFLWSAFDSLARDDSTNIVDDSQLMSVAIVEIIAGSLALWILRMRGWRWADFRWQLSIRQFFDGVMLFVGTYVFDIICWIVATNLFYVMGQSPYIPAASMQTHWLMVVYVSILNPFYEEAFLCAYLTNRLERYGPWAVIGLSAILRTSYHAYQGVSALVFILPFGLLFSFLFWRRRQLAPLVIAHAIFDLLALMPRS